MPMLKSIRWANSKQSRIENRDSLNDRPFGMEERDRPRDGSNQLICHHVVALERMARSSSREVRVRVHAFCS